MGLTLPRHRIEMATAGRTPRPDAELAAWLELHREEALEPEIPICDAHHHLWSRPESAWPGMQKQLHMGSRFQTRYELHDLGRDIASSGHNVVDTVYEECNSNYRSTGPEELRSLGETSFAQRCHDANEIPGTNVAAAIVGAVDLVSLGARAGGVLQQHMDAAPNFRGIRQAHALDPELGTTHAHEGVSGSAILTDPDFRAGFKCLGDLGLCFDAWGFFHQLQPVAELADAFPDTQIVLNHAGGPLGLGSYADRQASVLAEWKAGIDAVSACPNVSVKLGGCCKPLSNPGQWHLLDRPRTSVEIADALGPYYQ